MAETGDSSLGTVGTPEPSLGAGLKAERDPFADLPDRAFGPPMTVEEARAIVARITYKPGWRFTVERDGAQWALHATCDGYPDARGGEPFTRHAWRPLNQSERSPVLPVGEEGLLHCIRRAVHEWESHEADEWLRLDGEIVHDPHVCMACQMGGCRG